MDPATQHGAVMLDRIINQQAQIIAYVDDYKMMIFTTLPALLLLFLMRRPRQVAQTPECACGDGLTQVSLSGAQRRSNPAARLLRRSRSSR